MDWPTRGPFEVTQVQNNGTVTIYHGTFLETINIYCIEPYHIWLIRKKESIAKHLAFLYHFFMGGGWRINHCHANVTQKENK